MMFPPFNRYDESYTADYAGATGYKKPQFSGELTRMSTLKRVVEPYCVNALVCIQPDNEKQEARDGNYFNASWKARLRNQPEGNVPGNASMGRAISSL